MSYYYVRHDGTATADSGRTATKRTGAWSGTTSDYYSSLSDVYGGTPTTAPVSGDIVFLASDHSKSYSANTIITFVGETQVYSVDVTSQDSYLKGAIEGTSGGIYDLTFKVLTADSTIYFEGVTFKAQDDLVLLTNSNGGSVRFRDCTLELIGTSSNDKISITAIAGSAILDRCTLIFADTGQVFFLGNSPVVKLIDCELGATSSIVSTFLDIGKGSAIVKGGDFSGGATSMKFINGSVNGGICLVEGPLLPINSTEYATYGYSDFLVSRNAIKGTSNTVSITHTAKEGSVTATGSLYRDATYNGSTGYSLRYSTISTFGMPLRYTIHNTYFDISGYGTNLTFTIHFMTNGADTSLDTTEVWGEISYIDATSKASVFKTNRVNILGTGVVATVESGLWGGSLAGTIREMSMDIVIPKASMLSGSLSIDVCLSKDAQILYVDPIVDIA